MTGRFCLALLRVALVTYPREWREDYALEVIDVLAESGRSKKLSSVLGEAASLAANGLGVRLRHTVRSHAWFTAAAAAAVAMAAALFGITANAAAGLLADTYWTLRGSPGTPWIDPFWPTYAAWLVAASALIAGSALLSRVAAWGAVVASTGAVALRYWEVLGRDGDPVPALAGSHLVIAALAFAALLQLAGVVQQARRYLLRSRILLLVGVAWSGHVLLVLITHQPTSAVWATAVTAVALLAGFVHWATVVRGAVLIGVAFGSIAVARALDLLTGVASSGAARALALVTIAILAAVVARCAIRAAHQQPAERWRPIRSAAAFLVGDRRSVASS